MQSKVDHYMYYKKVGDHFIYVVLYVYKMLLVWKYMDLMKEVKSQLSSNFDMKDINVSNFILGIDIYGHHIDRKFWLI